MVYKEIQKFNHPWMWFLLAIPGIFIAGLFGFAINRQIIHGQKFGNHPISDKALILVFTLVLLLFILIALLFLFAKLTTLIDENGIKYRFFPFQFRYLRINWDLIEKCVVVTYHPVRDYGGWGIRSNKSGKAYNIAGDKGIQIVLKSGKIILIGTQNEAGLTDFLNTLAPLR